ncbi:MAG: ABC transporter ATP-binding protein [Pseudomonadota bacterium]
MIIEAHDLRKVYGRSDALRGLTFSVPEGSAFALIGANGAGKTTTIKVLMNILTASSGRASVFGVDSRALSPQEMAQIGYVSENQDMPGRMSVSQYLAYLRPFYPTWDSSLEKTVLNQLRLPSETKIGHLSHGMRLKLCLACALPFRPRLLVLDEPFSGLDPLVRDEFMEGLLGQIGPTTTLIASHELADIEGLVTHVAFLDAGRLVFQESMDELTGRLREVRVTLRREARIPQLLPGTWLQMRAMGCVLSFVETRFVEGELQRQIFKAMPGVLDIDVRPINLRSIFIALARDAQSRAA